jgi:hypothetical protein
MFPVLHPIINTHNNAATRETSGHRRYIVRLIPLLDQVSPSRNIAGLLDAPV